MDQLKALSCIIQGVQKAQSKGVYTLDEAELLSQAIKAFIKEDKNQTYGHEEHNIANKNYEGDVRKSVDDYSTEPINLNST